MNSYRQWRKKIPESGTVSSELAAALKTGGLDFDGAKKTEFSNLYLSTPLTHFLIRESDAAGCEGTNPEGIYPPFPLTTLLKKGSSDDIKMCYRPQPASATALETHFRRGYCELVTDYQEAEDQRRYTKGQP